MFCPKCGTLLRPTRKGNGAVLACPRCGYEANASGQHSAGQAAKLAITSKIQHSPKEKTVVLEGQGAETLSKLKDVVFCPKCGHNEVYYWMMQTRAADEPPTRFYRCAKCGHTWREYE